MNTRKFYLKPPYNSIILLFLYKVEELFPYFVVGPEDAEHGAGGSERGFVLDPAHADAEVFRLHHYPYPERLEFLEQGVRYLHGKPLLHLQAAGEGLHEARYFRKANDAAVRDIGDMGLPEEGQHVVLAERIESYVLDDDHLAVIGLEESAVEDLIYVGVVAGSYFAQRPGDALRGFFQAFPPGVFPQGFKDLQRCRFKRVFHVHILQVLKA